MNGDIGKTVEQILKNPEFTGIINELRGGNGENAPAQVSQEEILSHLPDVLSMLGPLMGGANPSEPSDTSTETPEPTEKTESAEKTVPASTAPLAMPKKYDKSRAEKLMSALKPYLSPNRCEIIDKCVSVLQITDVMEAIQGLEGITKPKP